MGLPRRTRIRIPQYADKTWVWNWIAGGVPVDFTGCTAVFALRVTPSDASPLLQISTTPTANGQLVLGTASGSPLAAGLVQLTLKKAVNQTLVVPEAHGEVILTMSDSSLVEFLRIDAEILAGSTY